MNEITMIAINKLRHHPKNPRKSIGDITELAESIKANGILQNLTVVQCPTALGEYWVVIGNRRLEAAKQAGIKELPCLISNMDEKEQFSTMLVENMQRADLTIPEQAEGFQLMIDMGESVESISDKTGFSQSTVRRRLDMAKLNKKKFEVACERGANLDDIIKISQIKSKSKQNEVLEKAGTNDFNYSINAALKTQKREENYKKAKPILLNAGLTEISQKESWSNKYEKFWSSIYNLNKDFDEDALKKSIPKTAQYYCFCVDEICFYKNAPKEKKPSQKKKTAEEIEQEQKIKIKREKSKEFFELRQQFINSLRDRKSFKNLERICIEAICEATWLATSSPIYTFDLVGVFGGDCSGMTGNEQYVFLKNEYEKAPAGYIIYIVYRAIARDSESLNYYSESNDYYKKLIICLYDFLISLGYVPCNEEKAQIEEARKCLNK